MFAHLPSLVLFVVGVGILLLPLARLARRERAKRGFVRAMGVVVGLEPVEHLSANTELVPTWLSSTRYRPIVEFTTASGEVHQCAGLQSLPEGALTVGEQLPVRHDPHQPDAALLDSYAEGAATLLIPALVCVGCVFFGLLAWSRWTL
jgi:hypothetical protein